MLFFDHISKEEQQQLPVHEWVAVAVIVVLLLLLSGSIFYSSDVVSQSAPHYVLEAEIECFVSGAVEKPGVYKVKNGSLLKDVLEMANVLPDANLKKLKLTKKVKPGQKIEVKSISKITVQISGAIETAGTFSLPKGTRICDLSHYMKFSDNADKKFLRKKRRLKDGEVLVVPVPEYITCQED